MRLALCLCILSALLSCHKERVDWSKEINRDSDIKRFSHEYHHLSDSEKRDGVACLINYYQFSDSIVALQFLEEGLSSGDPVVANLVEDAELLGVEFDFSSGRLVRTLNEPSGNFNDE